MKKTNTKTNPIIALEIQIEACRKNKQLLQNKIDAVIDIPNRIKALVAKQQKIEAAYRVLKINHLLQFDSAYIDTKARLLEFKKVDLQEELNLLQNQLKKENQRQESLKQTLFQKLELQRQQLMRQQIERAVRSKNKKKKIRVTSLSDYFNVKEKTASKVARFKESSGGSSAALTSRSSLWTVRKR